MGREGLRVDEQSEIGVFGGERCIVDARDLLLALGLLTEALLSGWEHFGP